MPYGFPEFGLSTPNGRPSWLTGVGKYIMQSGALFASYFNGNQQYPTLRLTDARSIGVWRSFVAASRAGAPCRTRHRRQRPAQAHRHPAPSGIHLAGLALSPPAVSLSSEASAALTVSLSQRADVTVCVLNAGGTVMRTIARPGTAAGTVKLRYLAYQRAGHLLLAGHYTVLVVASNASGSATAEKDAHDHAMTGSSH